MIPFRRGRQPEGYVELVEMCFPKMEGEGRVAEWNPMAATPVTNRVFAGVVGRGVGGQMEHLHRNLPGMLARYVDPRLCLWRTPPPSPCRLLAHRPALPSMVLGL